MHCGRGIAESTLKFDLVGRHVSTGGPFCLEYFIECGGWRRREDFSAKESDVEQDAEGERVENVEW